MDWQTVRRMLLAAALVMLAFAVLIPEVKSEEPAEARKEPSLD